MFLRLPAATQSPLVLALPSGGVVGGGGSEGGRGGGKIRYARAVVGGGDGGWQWEGGWAPAPQIGPRGPLVGLGVKVDVLSVIAGDR